VVDVVAKLDAGEFLFDRASIGNLQLATEVSFNFVSRARDERSKRVVQVGDANELSVHELFDPESGEFPTVNPTA